MYGDPLQEPEKGQTVKYPGADGETTVTFKATAVAVAGTPVELETSTLMAPDTHAPDPVLVSRIRWGT
jgi:hypothetical protein